MIKIDCIFCKIASGNIPTEKIYEDAHVVAFNDLTPQAPVHILIIPKEHIESANDINDQNADIIGHIFRVAKDLAKSKGISETGYRIVNNCGKDGGQSVSHLHFHLLGGRCMEWPAG